MYEAHYGLRTRPFTTPPDARSLFAGSRHALALDVLEYGLGGAGSVAVLTGDAGTGKTLLAGLLRERVGRRYQTAFLCQTRPPFDDLLRWVSAAFGLPHEGATLPTLHERLRERVAASRRSNLRVLLIVDEAQNLDDDALEQLRLLTNLEHGHEPALQLLLIGQPGLRARLQSASARLLQQRVGVDFHLPPFARAETAAYIAHRLAVAGAEGPLFNAAALSAVHDASGGLARRIDILCDLALAYGFAANSRVIDAGLIAEVGRDHGAAGTLPTDHGAGPR